MARFPYWIVLDTGMLRETAKGSGRGMDFKRLLRLRREAPVSLSQPAYVEFANQVLLGHVTFEQWQAIVPSIDAVLDPVHPIIPVGIALRVMLGVATATADQEALHRGLRGLRAMWAVLKSAKSPRDLREHAVVFEGETRRFRPSAIAAELERAEQDWRRAVIESAAGHSPKSAADERSLHAQQLRQIFGEADVAKVPELETVFAVALDWVADRTLPSPYQPKRNDALDFDQLLMLGLPSVVCTSDRRFQERVRRHRTPGWDRVLSPEELFARLEQTSP